MANVSPPAAPTDTGKGSQHSSTTSLRSLPRNVAQAAAAAPYLSPASSASTTPSTTNHSPRSPRPPPPSGLGPKAPPAAGAAGSTAPGPPGAPVPASHYPLPPATRQLRKPKMPLYVPAVLRPTEFPKRPAPPHTPPQSLHSSLDSLPAAAAGSSVAAGKPAPATTTTSPSATTSSSSTATLSTVCAAPTAHQTHTSRPTTPALLTTLPRPDTASTVSTLGGGPGSPSVLGSTPPSTTSSAASLASLPAAFTAASGFAPAHAPPPTRQHWKPDALAPRCDAPACPTLFGLLARRHHCRRCGGVFCAPHAGRRVPLDPDAEFVGTGASAVPAAAVASPVSSINKVAAAVAPASPTAQGPAGCWVRACDACWTLWLDLRRRAGGSVDLGPAGVAGGEGRAGALPAGGVKSAGTVGRGGESVVAGSAPKEFCWSTF